MTDATHVLTVAHNIYLKARGGWAKLVIVTPAEQGSVSPLGTYLVVRETIYTNYYEREFRGPAGFGFDVAQLRLAEPVVPGVGGSASRSSPTPTSGGPRSRPPAIPATSPRPCRPPAAG